MIECQKEITDCNSIIAHTNFLRRGVLSFIFLTLLCLKVSANGDYTTLHCDVSLWDYFRLTCHAIVTSPKIIRKGCNSLEIQNAEFKV